MSSNLTLPAIASRQWAERAAYAPAPKPHQTMQGQALLLVASAPHSHQQVDTHDEKATLASLLILAMDQQGSLPAA
ncbi:MAG: hypothetical protein ACK4Z0_00375 [Sphingomonadaceae bacterium]